MSAGTQVGQAYYELRVDLDEVKKGLSEADRKIDAHLRDQVRAFNEAAATMSDSMERSADRIEQAMGEASSKVRRKAKEMASGVEAELNRLNAGIGGRLGAALSASMQVSQTEFVQQLDLLQQKMTGVGLGLTAGVSAPLAFAAKAAFDATVGMDRLNQMLITTMGSTEAAAAEMEKLRKVAELPGVDLKQSVQLSVSLQQVGYSADAAREIMSQWSNELAKFGGGAAEFERMAVNLQQIQGMGKLTGDELREMGALIPSLRSKLQELYGTMDTAELAKMGLSGKQVIQDLTEAFAKMPRAPFDTLRNNIDNLNQDFEMLKAEAGEIFVPMAKELITTVRPLLKDLIEWFSGLDDEQMKLAASALGLTVAFGPMVLVGGQLVGTYSTLAQGAATLRLAQIALAAQTTATGASAVAAGGSWASLAALMANPVTLAIVGVTALAVGLKVAYDHVNVTMDEADQQAKDLMTSQVKLEQATATQSKAASDLAKEYESLRKVTKPSADQQDRMREILGKIVATNPDLIKGYDSQGSAIGLVVDAVKRLEKAYDSARIKAENLQRALTWDSAVRPLVEQRAALSDQLAADRALLKGGEKLSDAEMKRLVREAQGGDAEAMARLENIKSRTDAASSGLVQRRITQAEGRILELSRQIEDAKKAVFGKPGDTSKPEKPPLLKRVEENKKSGGKTPETVDLGKVNHFGKGKIVVSDRAFSGPEGRNSRRLNAPLVNDLAKIADELGLTLTVSSARRPASVNAKNNGGKSRHVEGSALDISAINGYSVTSREGRRLADLVDKRLQELGYADDKERGNAKAVLWRTMVGGNHFNHLHVSNTLKGRKNLPDGLESPQNSLVMKELKALEDAQKEQEKLLSTFQNPLMRQKTADAVSKDPRSNFLAALGLDPMTALAELKKLKEVGKSSKEALDLYNQIMRDGEAAYQKQLQSASAETQAKQAEFQFGLATQWKAIYDAIRTMKDQRSAEAAEAIKGLWPEPEAKTILEKFGQWVSEFERTRFKLSATEKAFAWLGMNAKEAKEQQDILKEIEKAKAGAVNQAYLSGLQAEADAITRVREELEALNAELSGEKPEVMRRAELLRQGVSGETADRIVSAESWIDQAKARYDELQSYASLAADGIAQAFEGIFDGKNPFQSLSDFFRQTLIDMAADYARSQLQGLFAILLGAGRSSGQASGLNSWLGLVGMTGSGIGSGIPGRATGGPVEAGKPYWVGERGRELMLPSVDGYILPAGQSKALEQGGGSGSVVNVTISLSGSGGSASDPAFIPNLRDQVTRAVQEGLRQARRSGG